MIRICIIANRSACGISIMQVVADGLARLNDWGAAVAQEWRRTPTIRPEVVLDAFVIMPNHLHAILFIDDEGRRLVEHVGATRWVARPCLGVALSRLGVAALGTSGPGKMPDDTAQTRATQRVAPTGPLPGSLGAIVGQFKSAATKRINALRGTPGCPVWQRNYYEHVIRDQRDLDNVRRYIDENPLKWAEDENHPMHIEKPGRRPVRPKE